MIRSRWSTTALLAILLQAGCARAEEPAPVEAIEPTASAPTAKPVASHPDEGHRQNVQHLTFGGENAEAYFSSDGQHIIFQSTRDALECDQQFTMRIDGGELRQISNGGRTTCGYYTPD